MHIQTNRKALITLLAALLSVALTVNSISASSTLVWQPASSGLPTNGLIRDVAFGDFDNDGQADLITAGTNGILVSKGDGTGLWNSSGFSAGLPTSGQYSHVVVTDFNRDGKLDIAATQSSTATVGAWSWNGAGTWTAWSGLPSGIFQGLAFADVDQNGYPDLIIAGGAPVYQGLRVFLNSGTAFTETTAITTTGQYYDIAASFVDNDGKVDLAAASANSSGLSFWRGSAAGWTSSSTGLPTTGTFRGATFGDIDLDGKPELLASRFGFPASGGGGIFIYRYDPAAGTWSLGPHQVPITGSYYKLELTDLNQDGWPDLVAGGGSTAGSPGLYTWLGSANGFSAAASPTATGSLDRIDTGDFDHNGLTDIAAADNAGAGALAWSNQGVRDPIRSWHPIPSPQSSGTGLGLALGDLNRDGSLDAVTSAGANAGLLAWNGGGAGWSACPISQAPSAQSGDWQNLAVGLFDPNSQEPDVIAASASGNGMRYFRQSGSDCASWSETALAGGSFRSLSAGTLNHDGFTDLIAAPVGSPGLWMWLGGASGWTPAPDPLVSGNTYATLIADFNHDGWNEIVTSTDDTFVHILQNNKIGTWTDHLLFTNGLYKTIAAGDLNNDGNLDLVLAANGGANSGIDVWLGDGHFGLNPDASPDTVGQYNDISLGDVNNDGVLDMLAASDSAGLKVWLGNVAGGWTPLNGLLPQDGSYLHAQFGQIDHDGNLDILATRSSAGLQMWTASGNQVTQMYLPLIVKN